VHPGGALHKVYSGEPLELYFVVADEKRLDGGDDSATSPELLLTPVKPTVGKRIESGLRSVVTEVVVFAEFPIKVAV
jgi:hypothetical protein